MSRKAQVISMDMLIALAIALVVFVFLVKSWNNYTLKLDGKVEYDDLALKSFAITELLVKSPGLPSSWEDNVSALNTLGLAVGDNVISTDKFNAFVLLDYNTSRDMFNIKPLHFYVQMKELNGSLISDYGNNTSDKELAVTIKRVVLYENEERFLEFTLWKS